MLKDLSQAGRLAVRRAYWTTDEPSAALARRYGVTPQEVEDLGQWRLFPVDEVPEWAFPGKPRGTRPRSILDLFALPPTNGGGPSAAPPPVASVPEAERRPDGRATLRRGDPTTFTDADVVELRETYVEERGILDSIAEAFEIPRERVVRLLRGEERPEAGGPIYPDLDESELGL